MAVPGLVRALTRSGVAGPPSPDFGRGENPLPEVWFDEG